MNQTKAATGGRKTEKSFKMDVTFLVKPEAGQYSALCLELDIASCGKTEQEAIESLKGLAEDYAMHLIAEGREKEIYRPVPLKAIQDFIGGPVPSDEIQTLSGSRSRVEIPIYGQRSRTMGVAP